MTDDMDKLRKAKAKVEARLLPPPGATDPTNTVHRVSIGLADDGKTKGVVVTVGPQMVAQGRDPKEVVPQSVQVDDEDVPVFLRTAEPPRIARLSLADASAQRVTSHRQCHNCPIPGGVQIAPQGKAWVGTLGFVLKGPDGKPWGITNEHVTDHNSVGAVMCQPDSRGPGFAKVKANVGIQFGNAANYIDASLLDLTMPDGKASCYPTQLDVGRLASTWRTAKLGDKVGKSGRTTGVVRGGTVTEIEATSHVGYDGGTARFERQLVFRGPSGDLSGPGDSGSLIFFDNDVAPCALLFAGGGGDTIGSPIAFVLEWAWIKLGRPQGDAGWKTGSLF